MKPLRLSIAQLTTRFLPPIVAGHIRQFIYPHPLARQDNYSFTVRSQTGSWFTSETSDLFAYPFSVYGYYNYRLWAIAAALSKASDTIIEVGANVGTETVGFADIVGCSGHVFAFEPFPQNINKLTNTLKLRSCQNVTILPVALGETSKKVQFVEPTNNNSGLGYTKIGNIMEEWEDT